WRGRLTSLPLIVPTPMTAPTGRNQNGEVSNRCLENTGERRFLIVEFDTGTTDEHAGLLFHLAQRAPLASAVFSGSDSLHGGGAVAPAAATTKRIPPCSRVPASVSLPARCIPLCGATVCDCPLDCAYLACRCIRLHAISRHLVAGKAVWKNEVA